MKKKTYEICAICGEVAKEGPNKKFKCVKCGSNISVVVSQEIFEQLVKKFGKK
jgi:predicted RNA-binding Zn-ribbon protein involved in translation (DUF1610 family)